MNALNFTRETKSGATADASALARAIAARLDGDAESLSRQWQKPEGTPTRHIIVDDLLSPEMADSIAAAFPRNEKIWLQRSSFRERKKTFAKVDALDPLIAGVTDAFHLDVVLNAVSRITELADLEADPELYAGGISMMGKGDFLNPHIDNSHDAPRLRYRRLNLLYYVSPGWCDENGGNFELWDPKVQQPKVITSRYNRLVVMETNRFSWHSVNPVVADGNRCCISNYYFSKGSPEHADYYHVTSFVGRPRQRLARIFGRIDNFARQWVAVTFKVSRGKSQQRHAK
jgi:Rps23 Pro-64 3,4-dihydroxylase Tpa1-like proline 4-hydroxylase